LNKVVAYLLVWLSGLIFIIGLLAVIFEEASHIRLIGFAAVIISLIFGNFIANKHWPKNKV
jgi:uncharacterized membrane protein YuzA (DUF378 family)